jgi:hypothetical protein
LGTDASSRRKCAWQLLRFDAVIAVLRARSKVKAAVTATTPVSVALGLWIVYLADDGDKTAVVTLPRSMLCGLIATATWHLAVWLAARAGLACTLVQGRSSL